MNRRHTLIAVGIVAVLLAFGAVFVSTRGATQKPDVVVVAGTAPATPGASSAAGADPAQPRQSSQHATGSHASEAPNGQSSNGSVVGDRTDKAPKVEPAVDPTPPKNPPPDKPLTNRIKDPASFPGSKPIDPSKIVKILPPTGGTVVVDPPPPVVQPPPPPGNGINVPPCLANLILPGIVPGC